MVRAIAIAFSKYNTDTRVRASSLGQKNELLSKFTGFRQFILIALQYKKETVTCMVSFCQLKKPFKSLLGENDCRNGEFQDLKIEAIKKLQ